LSSPAGLLKPRNQVQKRKIDLKLLVSKPAFAWNPKQEDDKVENEDSPKAEAVKEDIIAVPKVKDKSDVMLTPETCEVLRDSRNNYEPLEKLMCILGHGHVFGESVFLSTHRPQRFFNAVALTQCTVLSLSLADYEYVIQSNERKVREKKLDFLSSIPEFALWQTTKSKKIAFCDVLQPVSCIKNQVLTQQD
jgi:hypothetical protein